MVLAFTGTYEEVRKKVIKVIIENENITSFHLCPVRNIKHFWRVEFRTRTKKDLEFLKNY